MIGGSSFFRKTKDEYVENFYQSKGLELTISSNRGELTRYSRLVDLTKNFIASEERESEFMETFFTPILKARHLSFKYTKDNEGVIVSEIDGETGYYVVYVFSVEDFPTIVTDKYIKVGTPKELIKLVPTIEEI